MDHETQDTYDEDGDQQGLFLDDEVDEEDVGSVESPEDRLERSVQRAVDQALMWRDEELDAQQEKATDYYMGRPFGNEAKGRSRVVSTDVRDTVQAILPSLCRIFFGSEKTVEYEPRTPDDVPLAEQLTDMAGIVIRNDNDGFIQIHGAMKDAMVRKLGILKVWWEDMERTEGHEYTGLSEQQLVTLEQDEDNDVEVTANYPIAAPGTPMGLIGVYDATVTRTSNEGRCRFLAIPPEEFIFSPEARDRDTCEMMGHVRFMPASELILMGIDKDLVDDNKTLAPVKRSAGGDNLEAARRFDQDSRDALTDEKDESREFCWYGEVYIWADMSEEEDGTADLIRAEVIGENHEIVDWEYCDERPFALFTCDPEPHTLIGLSVADIVMDIQLIKSSVLRGMLDSLTLALNPRTVVLDGEVNMADVMNHEIGGVIRAERDVNAVKPFVHRFDESGAAAFPILQYLDEQKENRTGISKAAAGLNADALQSSTQAAVAATLSGAQQHIEMLARVFAETGMRQLYSLILKTLVKHQDQTRMVRLRNEWIEMDPTDWHGDMDISISLALGSGGSEEKVRLLTQIVANQEAQLQSGSPLVSYKEYRHTLARVVELAGFANADEFYKPFGDEEQQAFEQQQQQDPNQSPEMKLVEAQIEVEMARIKLEAQEAIWKDQRERAKIKMDYAIKQATAEAQYGAKIDNQELQADVKVADAIIKAAGAEAVSRQAGGGPTPNEPTEPAVQ